jgi:hypothetical protein
MNPGGLALVCLNKLRRRLMITSMMATWYEAWRQGPAKRGILSKDFGGLFNFFVFVVGFLPPLLQDAGISLRIESHKILYGSYGVVSLDHN